MCELNYFLSQIKLYWRDSVDGHDFRDNLMEYLSWEIFQIRGCGRYYVGPIALDYSQPEQPTQILFDLAELLKKPCRTVYNRLHSLDEYEMIILRDDSLYASVKNSKVRAILRERVETTGIAYRIEEIPEIGGVS